MTLGVQCERLDERCLSRARGAVEQETQLMRVSVDRVLACGEARRIQKDQRAEANNLG